MARIACLAAGAFRVTRIACGLAMVWSAFGATAFARGTPEIDPGSASSALTLLVGGALLLKGRFGRK
jgi:hypothetical protein